MAGKKDLKNLTLEQIQFDELDSRIFNLVIGRIVRRLYLALNETGKQNMEKIFLSAGDAEKEKFIKKNMPDFEKVFKEETKKLEKEIKGEIEKSLAVA